METVYGTMTDKELMKAIHDAMISHGLLDGLREWTDMIAHLPPDGQVEGMAILEVAIAEIGNRI